MVVINARVTPVAATKPKVENVGDPAKCKQRNPMQVVKDVMHRGSIFFFIAPRISEGSPCFSCACGSSPASLEPRCPRRRRSYA